MDRERVFEALWAVLAAPHHFMLHLDGELRWLPVREKARFRRTLGGSERLGSSCSVAAVPRLFEDRMAVGKSTVLWARTKSGSEVDALLSYKPEPTIILRDGETVRHTALWALSGELPYDWTLRLNKRIAHALGTAKHHADPTHFAFTPPGSIGEGGKVCQVVHMEPNFYGAREVAGRLAEAPDPKAAYRRHLERQAA